MFDLWKETGVKQKKSAFSIFMKKVPWMFQKGSVTFAAEEEKY